MYQYFHISEVHSLLIS